MVDCKLKNNRNLASCKKISSGNFKPAKFMKKVKGTNNWYSFQGKKKSFTKICSRNSPQKNIQVGEDLGSFKKDKSIRHIFGIGKSSKIVLGKSKTDTLNKSRRIVQSYIKKHDKC